MLPKQGDKIKQGRAESPLTPVPSTGDNWCHPLDKRALKADDVTITVHSVLFYTFQTLNDLWEIFRSLK